MVLQVPGACAVGYWGQKRCNVPRMTGFPSVILGTTDRQPLLLMPPAEGYFMVHTGNTWQRLIIQDPLKGPRSTG
jgi:hypothetical protein